MSEVTKINFDIEDLTTYFDVVCNLLDASSSTVNNQLPSEWIEENLIMTTDLGGPAGKFKFYNSPYTRELADMWHISSGVRKAAIMKAAQTGGTAGSVLAPLVWMIKNDPGNAMLLVGHNELLKSSATDIDAYIDNSGIRKLIQKKSKRARNTKTGDTDKMKEYLGGSFLLGLTNPDSLRQVSIRRIIVDDYDAMPKRTKDDGDIDTIIEQRTNAFAHNCLDLRISTPKLKGKSNIEELYEKGDKRKWHIPCPCCNEFIPIEWSVPMVSNPKEMAGITWKSDSEGELILESVGYTCQKCGGFFDDSNKMQWLNSGQWIPTAKSKIPNFRSYHISALIAPTYMKSWLHYVVKYINDNNEPNPVDRAAKIQSFYNLVLGLPYEIDKLQTSSATIQKNVRPYEIGTLPEKTSIADGNGKIILVTCGMDLNGKEDDARIDYEIKAYSEGGQSYSIDHGSFGSFIPKDKNPEVRAKLSYRHGVSNSVWKYVSDLLERKFVNDRTNKEFSLFLTGIDSGYMTEYVTTFINAHSRVVALKGRDDEDTTIRLNANMRTFKPSLTDTKLFLVNGNYTKDIIDSHMNLPWEPSINEKQPFGFMNYPTPSDGKYLYTNYFSHYESEQKVVNNGKYKWEKKMGKQNHMWDCGVYAEATKDIFVHMLLTNKKIKNGSWQDYVRLIVGRKKKIKTPKETE